MEARSFNKRLETKILCIRYHQTRSKFNIKIHDYFSKTLLFLSLECFSV